MSQLQHEDNSNVWLITGLHTFLLYFQLRFDPIAQGLHLVLANASYCLFSQEAIASSQLLDELTSSLTPDLAQRLRASQLEITGRRNDLPQNRSHGEILGTDRCTREQCRFVRSEISAISLGLNCIVFVGLGLSALVEEGGWVGPYRLRISVALIIIHAELGFYENSLKPTFSACWMSPLQLSHSSERANPVVSSPLEVDQLGNRRFL
jgi:hypothetical protein